LITQIIIISIYSTQKDRQNNLLIKYLSGKRQESLIFFTMTHFRTVMDDAWLGAFECVSDWEARTDESVVESRCTNRSYRLKKKKERNKIINKNTFAFVW